MTIVQWVARYGENFGAGPAESDSALVRESGMEDEETTVNSEATFSESRISVLAALSALSEIRLRYMDRMRRQEVIESTNARDASVIVRDATAQIQLLTGQPTGRSETRVRYVERGALREHSRRTRLDRVIEVSKPTDP
jgi:hypothetical protein